MKTSIYSLLSFAACGIALGQTTAYTTPVGYTTKTLAPNQFTLVGLTLHNSTVASGLIEAESATSVTDNDANFTTLLTAGETYIIEFPNGTLQEISSWSQSVLTTPDDITPYVASGDSYKIRKAATISEVFGANNSAGLTPDTDGTQTGADKILVLDGTAFKTVYYFDDGDATTAGWYDLQGNPANDTVVAYPDSLFVQRAAGSPLDLVITGEVKTGKTGGVLIPGFNYVNGVAPVGLTLANSGLETSIAIDTDGTQTNIDYVLLQQGGVYTSCYYFNDGDAASKGWYDLQGNSANDLSIEGGFLIKSASGPKLYTVNVPSYVAN